MGKTMERFHYIINKRARIVHFALSYYSSDGSGVPLLSSELRSEEEIDGYTTALKDDLDRVARLSKAALKRAKATPMRLFSESGP